MTSRACTFPPYRAVTRAPIAERFDFRETARLFHPVFIERDSMLEAGLGKRPVVVVPEEFTVLFIVIKATSEAGHGGHPAADAFNNVLLALLASAATSVKLVEKRNPDALPPAPARLPPAGAKAVTLSRSRFVYNLL